MGNELSVFNFQFSLTNGLDLGDPDLLLVSRLKLANSIQISFQHIRAFSVALRK